MAGEEDAYGASTFEVETWRMLLLFLLILIVETAWEFFDEFVTHNLAHKKQKGLLHAWEQLKFEIMALGLVSLLLVAFEEYLLKICIASKESYDDGSGYPDGSVDATYAPTKEEDPYADKALRRLLAAKESSCPEGTEPLWESKLIHKVHILIFLVAVAHVVYAAFSLGIAMWAIRRWRSFEETAQQGDLLPLPTDQLKRENESSFVFGLRQCVRQFTHPINKPTYIALRRMFCERMQLDNSFNFADFVSDFLAEEFAKMVKLEVLMWIIAMIWIVFPEGWQAGFWLTGGFILISLICGAKLHVVAMQLARYAYSAYYRPADEEPQNRPAKDRGFLSRLSLSRGSVSQPRADMDPLQPCSTGLPLPPVMDGVEMGKDGKKDKRTVSFGDLGGAAKTNPLARQSNRPGADDDQASVLSGCTGGSRKPGSSSNARVKEWRRKDFMALFWFKRPRLMLRIFQYAYFENALSFAVLIFSVWQNESDLFSGVVEIGSKGKNSWQTVAALVLLLVDVLLLVHNAAYILPVYALTAASINFGTPTGLIEFAKQRGIHPRLVQFLEDTMQNEGDTYPALERAMSGGAPSLGRPSGASVYSNGHNSNGGMRKTPSQASLRVQSLNRRSAPGEGLGLARASVASSIGHQQEAQDVLMTIAATDSSHDPLHSRPAAENLIQSIAKAKVAKSIGEGDEC